MQKDEVYTLLKKPLVPHPRAIASQKKIMDFLGMQEDFINLRDITPHISLKIAQIRRHLYRLHEQGLIEAQQRNGVYAWRKKRASE